jgi:hypothetical protein
MYKIIGIVVVVALIIGLLQILPGKFQHRSNLIEKSVSKQIKADTLDADIKISAISFYEEYDKCIKEPDQTIKSCLKKNTNSSSSLVGNKTTVQDPIFCSSVFPDSYAVDKIITKGSVSQVEVVESIANNNQKILLTLSKEENIWKVQKVSCPQL